MTGGAGPDRYVTGSPSDPGEGDEDTITDFAPNDALVLGDVLSLAAPGATGAELDDFLQFGFDGSDARLDIDQDGAGEFAAPKASVVFQGIDLAGGAGSPSELIDAMLASGQLEIAAAV